MGPFGAVEAAEMHFLEIVKSLKKCYGKSQHRLARLLFT
jgi:hypothetical protein